MLSGAFSLAFDRALVHHHTMSAYSFLLGVLVLNLSMGFAWAWSVDLHKAGDQMRAIYSENGEAKFSLIFGYGGCVAKILDHEQSELDLLAGPFKQEETDRVLQTVLWGVSDNANVGPEYPTRWNVNQAGTFENRPAQTVSFNVVSNQVLEIYSVNGLQWYQHLDDDYAGSQRVPQYTRYTCEPGGILNIRTVTRIPQITVSGVKQTEFMAYIEHWSAFKNSPGGAGFNAVAIKADTQGEPIRRFTTRHHNVADGALPDYPNWPLAGKDMEGYAFAFNSAGATKHAVAAMVFGKNKVRRPASSVYSQAVLNFKHWLPPNVNSGIGILPAVYFSEATPGTLIDFEYKLILRSASGPEFMAGVTDAVAAVVPPLIVAPDEAITGELSEIRAQLNRIVESQWGGLPYKDLWSNDGILHQRLDLF